MVVLWKCELHQWFISHQVIVIGEGSKADAFVVSELMYNSWFPVSLSGSFNFVFIYHEGRVQQCLSGCRVFTQHNYFARWTRKPANTIITKLHFGPFVTFNLSFFLLVYIIFHFECVCFLSQDVINVQYFTVLNVLSHFWENNSQLSPS